MEIFKEKNLFGLKNEEGEVIISPQYIDFYPFSCGLACVRNSRYQYAYINQRNETIVPFGQYIWLDTFFTSGYARVKGYNYELGKECWGIINTIGEKVVPMEYDRIWTLNDKYFDSLRAVKDGIEVKVDLRAIDNNIILDGLKYIKTFSIEEFKKVFNVTTICVRKHRINKQLYFTYGVNMGFVVVNHIPDIPAISIVSNSAGKVFCLLHRMGEFPERNSLYNTKSQKEDYVPTCNQRDYSTYEYKDYIEQARLDAYEGDESNYWNTD